MRTTTTQPSDLRALALRIVDAEMTPAPYAWMQDVDPEDRRTLDALSHRQLGILSAMIREAEQERNAQPTTNLD